MTRNAYGVEFQEAIRKGMAREIPRYEVIEARLPIKIPVRWKEKAKVIRDEDGKIIQIVWREYSGFIEYQPGEVLHREWRPASEWEIEEWKDLLEERLKELGVFRKDGEFSIQIVEKIKDLPAAIRQRGRHVPGRKIGRTRRKFTLIGSSQVLANYAGRLSGLLQDFLAFPKPGPQSMEKASIELTQISLLLKRSKASLQRKAQEEIQFALQGRFWEIPARTSQAITDLLNQRIKDYEIAMKSIELAEKLRDLMAEIERRFRDCYYRLGKRGEELQNLLVSGKEITPQDLLPIANEGRGIYQYLSQNIPNFNPYYQRLQEPEFQRLSRVVSHAQEGRAETVFNDIEEATAKLEAVAIGEKVTRAELVKEKETLF